MERWWLERRVAEHDDYLFPELLYLSSLSQPPINGNGHEMGSNIIVLFPPFSYFPASTTCQNLILGEGGKEGRKVYHCIAIKIRKKQKPPEDSLTDTFSYFFLSSLRPSSSPFFSFSRHHHYKIMIWLEERTMHNVPLFLFLPPLHRHLHAVTCLSYFPSLWLIFLPLETTGILPPDPQSLKMQS